MAMIYAFAALCLFGGAFAQVPGTGSCPKVETSPDFDLSRYTGHWYEAKRYFATFEIGAECVTANYTLIDSNTIKIVNTRVSSITGLKSTANATARIADSAEPGKLKVSYSSSFFSRERDYWILGTDYANYAVVYSCGNVLLTHMKFAWILTRAQHPSDEVIEDAYKVIRKNGLETSSFYDTDQNNCGHESASK